MISAELARPPMEPVNLLRQSICIDVLHGTRTLIAGAQLGRLIPGKKWDFEDTCRLGFVDGQKGPSLYLFPYNEVDGFEQQDMVLPITPSDTPLYFGIAYNSTQHQFYIEQLERPSGPPVAHSDADQMEWWNGRRMTHPQRPYDYDALQPHAIVEVNYTPSDLTPKTRIHLTAHDANSNYPLQIRVTDRNKLQDEEDAKDAYIVRPRQERPVRPADRVSGDEPEDSALRRLARAAPPPEHIAIGEFDARLPMPSPRERLTQTAGLTDPVTLGQTNARRQTPRAAPVRTAPPPMPRTPVVTQRSDALIRLAVPRSVPAWMEPDYIQPDINRVEYTHSPTGFAGPACSFDVRQKTSSKDTNTGPILFSLTISSEGAPSLVYPRDGNEKDMVTVPVTGRRVGIFFDPRRKRWFQKDLSHLSEADISSIYQVNGTVTEVYKTYPVVVLGQTQVKNAGTILWQLTMNSARADDLDISLHTPPVASRHADTAITPQYSKLQAVRQYPWITNHQPWATILDCGNNLQMLLLTSYTRYVGK